MSNKDLSSDMPLLNLKLLTEMQAAAKTDPVSACFHFGVTPEQLMKVADLSRDDMHGLVVDAGQQFLFSPIDDLWKRIDARRQMARPSASITRHGWLSA